MLGSQLRERRRQVHAAVARAFEQQDAEHLDERAALLAHHWEQAGARLAERAAALARAHACYTRFGMTAQAARIALQH